MVVRKVAWALVAAGGLVACSSTVHGTGGSDDGTSDGGSRSGDGGRSKSDGGADPYDPGVYEADATPVATRPPPVITSVGPLEGDYGTIVTITGDNLDEASARLILDGPAEALTYTMPAADTVPGAASVIVKWSKTEIQLKYPFPAEGGIRIATRSGEAEGDSFVPTWSPGSPVKAGFVRGDLLDVVAPSAGTLVAAFDGSSGPYIVIAKPNGAVETKAFPRGASALLRLSLYATPAGDVDGFYSDGSLLWQLTGAMSAPSTTSTGVAATAAAGNRDATGPYAWVRKTAGKLVRVRPPTWAEDVAPVTDPTPASAPGPSIAVAPDHSVYAGWGVNSSGSFPLYDHTAHPVVARLRPGQTTFDASKTAGGSVDDYMVWTRFRPGPNGRVASFYCATDTGFGSATTDCSEGYLGNGGASASYAGYADHVAGYNATTAAVALCDQATSIVSLGPEGDTAQQKPAIFPCPTAVLAVGVDPAGSAAFLVRSGDYVYSPRKR
jgi:hypothetical protein